MLILLGDPYHIASKSPIYMDKYCKTKYSYCKTQIGILVSMRSMTIVITPTKRSELLKPVTIMWNSFSKCFSLRKDVFLFGLVPNLAQTIKRGYCP